MVTNKKKMKTSEEMLLAKRIHKDSDLITVYKATEIMEEYARLQIEKDRERVKANVKVREVITYTLTKTIDGKSYTNSTVHGSGIVKSLSVDLQSIDETPIILT